MRTYLSTLFLVLFLNPVWRTDGSPDSNNFGRAISLLDSECAKSCGDPKIAQLLTLGSQEVYHPLYDKVRNADIKCQRALFKSLTNYISLNRVHKDCLQEKSKTHLSGDRRGRDYQQETMDTYPACNALNITERFSQIADIVYGTEVVETTESQAPCLQCIISESKVDEPHDLSQFVTTLEKTNQCSELQPGREKIIFSDTGLDKSYSVKRESDGAYSIYLNLQFSTDSDYNGVIPANQIPDHYIQKTQRCLNQANQKMLGPNGEQLKIVIGESEEQEGKNCSNDKIEIKIGSISHRSNASKYAFGINCPTIVHEILHLLGLCDEYQEKYIGYYVDSRTGDKYFTKDLSAEVIEKLANDERYSFQTTYDCRVTSILENNIMTNQKQRWRNVFEYGESESLLTPGQFNAILYGSCEQNQLFNKCSQLAYKSSLNTNCLQEKEQCEVQNISRENKQQMLRAIKKELKSIDTIISASLQGIQRYEDQENEPDEQTRRRRIENYEINLSKRRKEKQDIKSRLERVNSWPL